MAQAVYASTVINVDAAESIRMVLSLMMMADNDTENESESESETMLQNGYAVWLTVVDVRATVGGYSRCA